MASKDTRYYAQIGPELVEIPADQVELHKKGARLSTSAAVRHLLVRVDVDGVRYEGTGSSWKAAEKDAERQMPKGKP